MSTSRVAMAMVVALIIVLLSSPAGTPTLFAAEPSGATTPLDIALVDGPAINCRFVVSCVWPVLVDDLSEIPLAGTNGLGRLQTRLFAPGETGTAAEGLYPYLYRFNFFEVAVTTPPVECVASLAIPFGEIAPVDYDEDGEPDDLFVIQGTGGPPHLSGAEQLADGTVVVTLTTPLCPGAPGAEGGSYFVGLASALPPTAREAVVGAVKSGGDPAGAYTVATRAPGLFIYLPTISND